MNRMSRCTGTIIVLLGVLASHLVTPASAAMETSAPTASPPISLRFTLAKPGYVTLVIDDAQGQRVRNLISDTYFAAGAQTVYWDGADESLQLNRSITGNYTVAGTVVPPATYRIRGLYHDTINLRYELTVNHGGNPPWRTTTNAGGWLADHSPPSAVVGLADQQQMLIGCHVYEAGDGLVLCNLGGERVSRILTPAGGGWWGAQFLARDAGAQRRADVVAYSAAGDEGHFEIWALGPNRQVVNQTIMSKKESSLGGLAVHNGIVVASLPNKGELYFFNDLTGKRIGVAACPAPGPVVFDAQGRLLVVSKGQVLRYATLPPFARAMTLPEPEVVIADGLGDPRGLTTDADGHWYVSDWQTNQVKVFAANGQFLLAIGEAGPLAESTYNPRHMNHPTGIAIAADGNLWVAEQCMLPKRVSIWTPDGTLVKAMYGPSPYGGGGFIDPVDKTRCYLHGNAGGMEFTLDWSKGAWALSHIYYNPAVTKDVVLPGGYPTFPLYVDKRQYLTNVYGMHATNGEDAASIWRMRDHRVVPVASLGTAHAWDVLKGEAFRDRWPKDCDPRDPKKPCLFAWSDLNADGQVQPDEVQFSPGVAKTVTVGTDLSMVTTGAVQYRPVRFTPDGIPVYDLSQGEVLYKNAAVSDTSGGGQVLHARDGWTVLTFSPVPDTPVRGVAGVKNGKLVWAYPSEALGLHAAHFGGTPVPSRPGQLLGMTRLAGGTIVPKGSNEELWALNGDFGNLFLMTTDGFFVSTLFKDSRTAPGLWPPTPLRGMQLNDVSLREEAFYTSINQTADGAIYVIGGHPFSSLIKVEGLETLARLPEQMITITPQQVATCEQYLQAQAQARVQATGRATLKVRLATNAPTVDGDLADWSDAQWGAIDGKASAAVRVAGDRLYAAFKTDDPKLLANAGGNLTTLFQTGGGLDLMVGADPGAPMGRQQPVSGDARLFVTNVKDAPVAMLYRPVMPQDASPVVFKSWWEISMDRVDEVTKDVQVAGRDGNYELSVPLATLGLHPTAGMKILGDIGMLRGNGVESLQRLYWHNKSTGTVSDTPSEAQLTPGLWGEWVLDSYGTK